MQLRDYQIEIRDKARQAIREGYRKPVIVAPCGSGKSAIAYSLVEGAVQKDSKVLLLAHRRLLVNQLYQRFIEYGLSPSVLMSGEEFHRNDVVIATKQTYVRRMRLVEKEFNQFWHDADMVIVDEAHFCISPDYMEILNQYQDKVIIGLTATPARADERGLGIVFNKIIQGISHGELVQKGYLVKNRYFTGKEINLKGLKTVNRDYEKEEAGQRVITITGDIIKNWLEKGEDRQTICFCPSVRSSRFVEAEFKKAGVEAKHIDAKTSHEERKRVLELFNNGQIKILTNCGLMCEGIDTPCCSCIILARPTKSLPLFWQMTGRGSRPYESKEDCLVFDHGQNIQRHGFIEDPVVWSLDDKKKAWHKPKRRKKDKKRIECGVCGCIFETARVCPACGTEVVTHPLGFRVLDCELQEVARTKKPKKKKTDVSLVVRRAVYAGLLYKCQKKGYKRGWAGYIYKAIFGEWPKHQNVWPCKARGQAEKLIQYGLIKNVRSQKAKKKKAKKKAKKEEWRPYKRQFAWIEQKGGSHGNDDNC